MKHNDQQFIAQKIRSQYTEKVSTEVAQLKALDARVKTPANVFAYVWGGISALIMGAGMSLTMTDLASILNIPSPMTVGVIVGTVGIAMAAVTYPIWRSILKNRRAKYASEILALSEKILAEDAEN